VAKGKLSKFEELKTFDNVFQPEFEQIFQKDFEYKGCWASRYFRNSHPIILELGCGKGEYATGLAERFPGTNFIGVDIKGARIWTGAKKAYHEKIANVAFIRTPIELIDSFFSPGEVDEIWLTFPDPQLKKGRNKKRLTAPRFLNLYRSFLKNEGIVHLKTDNAALYGYTLELARHNRLRVDYATSDLYGCTDRDMVHGIQTFYEKQFIGGGLKIHYLKFRLSIEKNIMEPEEGRE
jgi:tRNA (guanine-N7-)-methyltransferase